MSVRRATLGRDRDGKCISVTRFPPPQFFLSLFCCLFVGLWLSIVFASFFVQEWRIVTIKMTTTTTTTAASTSARSNKAPPRRTTSGPFYRKAVPRHDDDDDKHETLGGSTKTPNAVSQQAPASYASCSTHHHNDHSDIQKDNHHDEEKLAADDTKFQTSQLERHLTLFDLVAIGVGGENHDGDEPQRESNVPFPHKTFFSLLHAQVLLDRDYSS